MRNNVYFDEETNTGLEPIRFRNRRRTTIHSEIELENFILRTIMDWAKDDYVCPNALFAYICKAIDPPWMHNNISTCRNWKTHVDIIQRIDSNIRAMLTLRPAVTFYDVQKVVEQFCPDHRCKIGPLQLIPIVRQSILCNYNLRQMTPQLRLNDLIVDCAEFINRQVEQSRRPCDEAVIMAQSEQQFLHFLKDKYQRNSVKELGIRITNFPALRDAVHVHKIDNFLTDMKSKKLSKLMRSEVALAMTNIVNKLRTTKVFPKECDAKTEIEKFASLPFPEAIEKFFRPFLDEEERILEEHELKKPNFLNGDEDPLAVVRQLFEVLSKENVYGPLFHLSAIIGTVHEAKDLDPNVHTVSHHIDVQDLSPDQWKKDIFVPLLRDVSLFLQLSFEEAHVKKLAPIMASIVDKCVTVIDMLKEPYDVEIVAEKRRCLDSLSSCSQNVVDYYKGQKTLTDNQSLARLQLDLLPQIYRLLISLLSKSVLASQDEDNTVNKSNKDINKRLIDIVYAAIKTERLSALRNEKLPLDRLLSLEAEILEILQLHSWPLQGSFLDYVISKPLTPLAQQHEQKNADYNDVGPCLCLAMSQQLLTSKLQRLPKAVKIGSILSEVLLPHYGLLTSPSTQRQIEAAWEEVGDVMEDGAPPVIDLQAMSMARGHRPVVTVTDIETVMAAIADVCLLDDVCHATKWNELYRHHWGDISLFVQQNVLLASTSNVRIIETQRGRLRINVSVTEAMVSEAASGLNADFRKYSRIMIGLFVSAVVVMKTSIINLIVQSVSDTLVSMENVSQMFSDFFSVAMDAVPSEVAVDVFSLILRPISLSLFSTESTAHIQRSLSSVPLSTVDLLRQSLSDDPALAKPVVRKPVISTNVCVENEEPRSIIAEEKMEEIENENKMDVNDVEEAEKEQLSGSREIVEDIRRLEFGVGHTDEDGLVASFNRRMARLVEHFSCDLYANPTHFVLELIQNADDNRYPIDNRPQLNLCWKQNGDNLTLTVRNNENGFCADDLRSLCDIGASTKVAVSSETVSASRPDKIGRKGIGFKSVFLVSNRPEVHSNGFHVRFSRYSEDDGKTPSNALVPTWIKTDSDEDSGTRIVLPIIERLRETLIMSVTQQLHPSLLLFLRRLKRISMATPNSDDGENVTLELVDEECTIDKKVVITGDGTKHSWFLWSRRLTVGDDRLTQLSPRQLSVTEVSIAVPLDDDNGHDVPAFAYLPIRSYGLRFIVNADFSIPASREDVAAACPWNRYLVEQAAEVFVLAVRRFLSQGSVYAVGEIARFVDCVPLLGEVPGDCPFSVLVPRMRALLADLAWLPDQDNRLYRPAQLIVEAAIDDRRLTQLLCTRLNMSFLHPSIDTAGDERRLAVLKWLGCQQLSLSHLASLLAALSAEDLTDDDLVRSVLVAVHAGLQKEGCPNAVNRVLSLLKSTQVWPLHSGEKVRIDCGNSAVDSPLPVFLPPTRWLITPPPTSSDRYRLLRRVISPSFLASFTSSPSSVNPAIALLRRLGAHDLTNTSMIEHAISPRLSSTNYGPPTRQWFITASQYLTEHCSPQQYLDTVSPRLQYATVTHTSTGIRPTLTPHSDMPRVHLPLSIEPQLHNVTSLLENRSLPYTVVDDSHIRLNDCTVSLTQWSQYFFDCAGASRSFHGPEELTALLSLDDGPSNEALLRYLDVSMRYLPPGLLDTLVATSTRPWIPVSKGGALHLPPDCVYLVATTNNDNPLATVPDSLLSLFPVCPVLFTNEALPRRLGLSAQVTCGHLLHLLKRVLVDHSVVMTTDQVQKLYTWAARAISRADLTSVFSELRRVLDGRLLLPLPDYNDNDSGDVVELRPVESCYWTLPIYESFLESPQVSDNFKALLTSSDRPLERCGQQRPLSRLFPNLRELFVEVIGVSEYSSIDSVSTTVHETLSLLTSDRLVDLNLAEVDLVADVYNLLHRLCDRELNQDTHRRALSRLSLLPCLSGRYRSPEDTRLITVYSWRSRALVDMFQQLIALPNSSSVVTVDFLAFNIFSNRRLHSTIIDQRRLSAPQFLAHYFPLPVLEDRIERFVDNRDSFAPCGLVKSMFAHLEVLLSQWLQRNLAPIRETLSHCMRLLSSVTTFCRGNQEVNVRTSLQGHPDLFFDLSEKVYISTANRDGVVEMLIGGVDFDNDGIEIFDVVMRALADWLLEGDMLLHMRDRFRKFYKSLLDLIESSDRNQVSIFIRSHNLRINPFCIEYIYDMFSRRRAELVSTSPCLSLSPPAHNEPLSDGETVDDNVVSPPSSSGGDSETRKRKATISLDDTNGVPIKQARLSRPGTPQAPIDQISLRSMDAMLQSGRLGEQLAYNKLVSSKKLGDNLEVLKVDWVNEHSETRLPYDFKLVVRRIDTGTVDNVYLEVKATTHSDKRQFDFSAQEVTSAWSFKAQYHLLIVFHGGLSTQGTVKYAHIPDVLGQLQDNHCRLLVDLGSIFDRRTE